MTLVLRATLLFGLIWALTSFLFAAVALATLFGEPSHIEAAEIYGVAAMSAVAAFIGLVLAALVAMRLIGRSARADLVSPRGLMIVAACLAGIAALAFAVSSTMDQQDSFFLRFVAGARFEFLVIGLAALVMGLRRG
jgi:hypothetical protein